MAAKFRNFDKKNMINGSNFYETWHRLPLKILHSLDAGYGIFLFALIKKKTSPLCRVARKTQIVTINIT